MLKRRADSLVREMTDNQTTSIIDRDARPQEVLSKMRDDVSTKKHLVQEILPRELHLLRKYVQDLEEIENSTATTDLLNKINERISSVNREINTMMERKMLLQNPMDDKLSIFQQNVSIRHESDIREVIVVSFRSGTHPVCQHTNTSKTDFPLTPPHRPLQ